jgi:hypothetical protein
MIKLTLTKAHGKQVTYISPNQDAEEVAASFTKDMQVGDILTIEQLADVELELVAVEPSTDPYNKGSI